jgi:Family of unknown function (DUF6491)
MRYPFQLLAATGVTLLGACASGPPHQSSQDLAYERYLPYAGPPISSFWWPMHFDSWEPLGHYHLAVYTTPWDAYLLTVSPPCDMRFVINAIGITTTVSTVYAHLDSVTLNSAGTGPGPVRCQIEEIHRIDVRRMRADRKAGVAPPGAAAATPADASQSPPPASAGAPPPQ